MSFILILVLISLSDELEFLDARSKVILDKFYATIGHQRKEKTETKRYDD